MRMQNDINPGSVLLFNPFNDGKWNLVKRAPVMLLATGSRMMEGIWDKVNFKSQMLN